MIPPTILISRYKWKTLWCLLFTIFKMIFLKAQIKENKNFKKLLKVKLE